MPAKKLTDKGEMRVDEAGRKGGNLVKERYGLEYYGQIGKKGGQVTKERHGPEFYSEIGRKGAEYRKMTPEQRAQARTKRLSCVDGRGPNLIINTERITANHAIITVRGELDVYTVNRFKDEMVGLISDGTHCIALDLNRLEYLDGTGIGAMIGALKVARERDGNFRLVCGNPRIYGILEITGLTKIFEVHEKRTAALEALLKE